MDFQDLYKEVIGRGLCTGCGTCAGICPTKGVTIVYVDHEIEPRLSGDCTGCSLCYEVCPGQDVPMPDLDKMVFGRYRQPAKELLGVNRKCLAGHALDPKIRATGASGGVITALLLYALEQGIIEGALVGQMDHKVPWHTLPVYATTREEVIASAQSKYQVVPTNAALSQAIEDSGRRKMTGHVGLGCHVEALRKLQLWHPGHKTAESIAFFIGIGCHANFYTLGTELLILEGCGITCLDEVAKVEYRGGEYPGNFTVTKKNGQVSTVARADAVGFLIKHFRRDRCLMCTDWSCELADVSVADYWGPEIPEEGKNLGWSSIMIKTEKGEEIVKDAEAKGYILTQPTDDRYLLLHAGVYQKKHGAVYNILQRKRHGWPVPDYHYPLIIEPIARDLPFDMALWPHRRKQA